MSGILMADARQRQRKNLRTALILGLLALLSLAAFVYKIWNLG